MKNIRVMIFSFLCANFINIIAQVDTSWVKRFNGPLNSSDAGVVVKADENGFIYVGASISKTQGYTDAAVIKYNPNGDTLWVRYYNNPLNLGSTVSDMKIDNNGNIIITGSSGSNNYGDILTAKFNPDGNLLWARIFDDGDIDISNSLILDDAGNVYITGTTWKVNLSYNFLTIKYSSSGDTVWTFLWYGLEGAGDMGKDIVLDKYNNVVVAGTTDWYWGTIDYVTIKIDQLGDTVWVKKYDSPDNGHDYLKKVGADEDGNIIVAGDSYKAGGNHDIIIVKYDVNGDTIWTRRYNGTGNGDDFLSAMEIDSSGNIYLAGSSFVSGNGMDCLTIKYNSEGGLVWVKTYAEYSYHPDVANSITLDKLGNIYVTGATGTSSSNIAYLTLKYDNDGNEEWNTKYDGPGYNGYDVASSICVDNSDYVYITGSSAGLTSVSDIATIKYTQSPSDVNENSAKNPALFLLSQNYPNPFNPSTKIKYQVSSISHVSLVVYDILGNEIEKLVNEEKPSGSYEVTWYPENLPSGVYFYQLRAGEFVETKKLMLLK